MEKCLDYLPRKSFNTYGFVVLLLFVLVNVVVISISSKSPFNTIEVQCYDKSFSKKKDVALTKFVNTKCSLEYQEKFHFIKRMNVILIVNFGIVFGLSIIYAYLVKGRVEKFDYQTGTATTNNNDDENQEMLSSPNPGQNSRDARECLGHFSTFFIYIVHLFVARIIPLLVFSLCVFYPAQIPNNFPCPWQPEMQGKGTVTFNDTQHSLNSRYNLTIIDCKNPNGEKSETLVDAVATWNVIFVILAVLELGYIAWLTFNDSNFMTDKEFCTVYLLRKRKRIRKLVNKVQETFSREIFELKDDFGGIDISRRDFDKIYVNVIIKEGREHVDAYPSIFNRHEIYQYHLETPKTVTTLLSTADIFKPKKGEQKYPRTILVIGRPGIGKTMLARKLLHEWKVKEDKFWHKKIVILLRFRTLNNKTLTLREMLGYGEGLTKDNFRKVYDFIMRNPTNTILIFDGLDELTVDQVLLGPGTETISSNEKMPVFSIFKLLLHDKLLPGVTVLTTSRPTAEHFFPNLADFKRTVEILGFSEEQIKEYVFKFCENDNDTSELIWNRIEGSAELLSLCYIPVNCYIVCLTFKKSIEDSESGEQFGESSHGNIPKTITELYKRAVKLLLYSHHPVYKLPGKQRPKGYLIKPFPKELENDLTKLKELAISGISQGKLVFERDTDEERDEFANCGMFNKLQDKERNLFCFLHLTIQEFLAALKVVDDMDNVGQFLDTHNDDPKWHLVIQFVAGLVGDKIREAKMTEEGDENSPEQSKRQELIDVSLKRFKTWTFQWKSDKIPFLGIKCLYELQEIDVMKSVSKIILAGTSGFLQLRCMSIRPVDSTAFFQFLGNCNNLKHLFFHQCTIQGNYSYRMMEKSLFNAAGNTITTFSWNGGLTNESIKYISNALNGKHNQLTELFLKDITDITDESVEYLGHALKSENCKLTKLVITPDVNVFEKEKIKIEVGSTDVGDLENQCKIGDKGVKYLCDAIESGNCKLYELDLTLNDSLVTLQGIQDLCDVLTNRSCKITDLSLSGNAITDREVECLSNVCENGKVNKLKLQNNKITEVGVKCLSDALKSENCELRKLILNNNEIRDNGAKYLSDALKSENCKLQSWH